MQDGRASTCACEPRSILQENSKKSNVMKNAVVDFNSIDTVIEAANRLQNDINLSSILNK